MYFYDALRYVLTVSVGAKVARKAWDDKKIEKHEKRYICKGYESGKYFIQFRYISLKEEKYQFYTPSQEDMIADDWYIVTEV